MKYAPYFLTVYSIVRFARSQGILCQGRGSAANSAVCYMLGITSIDPDATICCSSASSRQERDEPPDIDVDFEHMPARRGHPVDLQDLWPEKAALCATVTRYRAKGALRDVGKALGLPEDMITALSAGVWGWSRRASAKSRSRAQHESCPTGACG
jgi:error-prone DNA polymerase